MNFLIFPTQLFYDKKHISFLKTMDNIFIIEEPRYFTDFNFHKMKLVYHRATMKKYYNMLKKYTKNVHYIEFHQVKDSFYKSIKDSVHMIMLPDHKLETKLKKIYGKRLTIMENINMLIKQDELETVKNIIYKNKYSHDEFYKYMRRKLNILVKNDKPIGNKWSFDSMNRLPLPKNYNVPITKPIKKNSYYKEAIEYVNNHFKKNYGNAEGFFFPIDHKQSIKWLNTFLEERLKNFGAYEDAVHSNEPFINHSVLSPMMNIGILTDMDVVTISYKKGFNNKIPIESFEGFIRQVIGWRNYVYTLYCLEGENMRKSNQLKHTSSLPYKKFWEGTTNILPIDTLINKIKNYAYVHHIERLMYLGNFMLLCMIHPNDIYKIFMEWTIDSYDWVMVPNVYGMSQFASPIMMTRPYFSSSNYIQRMSNFKRDGSGFEVAGKTKVFPGSWDVIWDALYYNFIHKHYDLLKKNYATSQQVKHWDNKTDKEKQTLIKTANNYLKLLGK